jgi:hypothetical protein
VRHGVRFTLLFALAGCFRSLDPTPAPTQPESPTPPVQVPPTTPPPPPPQICGDSYLGGSATLVADGTTLGGANVEVCGVNGPSALFTWTAPGAGVYTVSVTASFPLDLDVAADDGNECIGPTLGCGAEEGAVSFTAGLGELVDIVVVARDGVGGNFELTIGGPAPACGDGVCDAGEDCSSCAEDCGECPVSSYCGDGFCDIDEDAESCPEDCSACGDGICDVYEDCSICDADCGVCPDQGTTPATTGTIQTP